MAQDKTTDPQELFFLAYRESPKFPLSRAQKASLRRLWFYFSFQKSDKQHVTTLALAQGWCIGYGIEIDIYRKYEEVKKGGKKFNQVRDLLGHIDQFGKFHFAEPQ